MYISTEDLRKHLIFEEANLKNMRHELELRKLSNQPIERLVYEIHKAEQWYAQLKDMFEMRLQGV